jgi:hypothetical protein
MRPQMRLVAIGLWALACLSTAFAQIPIASSSCPDNQECLDITHPTIVVDANDWAGVHIAVEALADDFERVTSTQATVLNYTGGSVDVDGPAILVGSVGNSSLIQQVEDFNTTGLEGQWETFITAVVDSPIDGVDQALVIAGSDKRGTIYGIYTLSEDIGVSPCV